MIDIPVTKELEPYFKIAEETAKKSPCLRRQYGALIVYEGTRIDDYTAQYNSRVSHCCGGSCARTDLGLTNGEKVEVGAEIHAETAALIADGGSRQGVGYFILVGFAGDRELLSEAVYPCHTCALNIKFAGFKWVYIKTKAGIVPRSINEIIQYREREWYSDEQDA